MARLSLRIDTPAGRIGPGKRALLAAVDEHGSVSAAARALGMSYRRAWGLTETLNALADEPLIEKAAGGAGRGGARLTERGAAVLALCRAVDEQAERATRAERAALDALLKAGTRD